MKRLLIVLLLLLSGPVATTAQAGDPDQPIIVGRVYDGYSYDGTSSTFLIGEVLSQNGRRFDLRLLFEDKDCILRGTIASSFQVSATGRCGSAPIASHVNVWGEWIADVERPQAASLRWITTDTLGNKESGNIVMLNDINENDSLFEGTWTGEAFDQNGAALYAIFAEWTNSDHSSGVSNIIQFEDKSTGEKFTFDVLLDLKTPSDSTSPYGMSFVGGGPSGLLMATGDFTPEIGDSPAQMQFGVIMITKDTPPSNQFGGKYLITAVSHRVSTAR